MTAQLGTIADVAIARTKAGAFLGIDVVFLDHDTGKETDRLHLPRAEAPAVAAKLLHCGLHPLARSIADAWFAGEAADAGLNYELRP